MLLRIAIDAFLSARDSVIAVEGLSQARVFARSRISRFEGGLDTAVAHYQSHPSPEIVLVEEEGGIDQMMAHLDRLAEVCLPTTRVVVVGRLNDIGLYRALIKKGVSEYLVHPLTTEDLSGAIARLFSDPANRPSGRLLSFVGARGGVGSSTLAHNVAWSLSQIFGDDVLLVDLDLAFGTSALSFNTPDSRQSVGDVLAEAERIDGQLLERIVKKQGDHLELLCAPALLKAWPVEVEAIDRLLEVARQMASFVVVDVPHQWTPWVRHILETSDETVIVAQPDLPNLRDAKNLLDLLNPARPQTPPLVVLNKMDLFKRSQLAQRDFEDTLKVKLAAKFPFEPLFGQTANDGQMLGELATTHRVTEAIHALSETLAKRARPKKRKAGGAARAWDTVATRLKIAKVVS